MGRVGRALLPLLVVVCGCSKEIVPCRVESNPTSAEVWVGAVQKDSTPCTLVFDSEGTYNIFIKKPGYLTLKKQVTVIEREDVRGETFLQIVPESMTATLDPVEAPAQGATSDAGGASVPPPYYGE